MANLHIPFLMLQENAIKFTIDSRASRIVINMKSKSSEEQPNLLVLADKETGCLVLCQQQSIVSNGSSGSSSAGSRPANQINKFIVSISPRVFCVPSIYPASCSPSSDQGCSLLDFCLVKCLAPKILNTSEWLLATLHREGETKSHLRLWGTEDGRCIMTSPISLFHKRKPKALHTLSDKDAELQGKLLCFCESKEILIINVYQMTLVHVISGDFENFQKFQVDIVNQTQSTGQRGQKFQNSGHRDALQRPYPEVRVSLTDATGSIYTWSGQSLKQDSKMQKRAPTKKRAGRQSSSVNLAQCNMDNCQLVFDLESSIQGRDTDQHARVSRGRGAHRGMLHFGKIQSNKFMIVYQDQIKLLFEVPEALKEENDENQIQVLLQYEKELVDEKYNLSSIIGSSEAAHREKWYIYATILDYSQKQLLICVDSQLNLLIYDVNVLLTLAPGNGLLIKLNLFDNAHLFDMVSKLSDESTGLTLLETQEELMQTKLKKLKNILFKLAQKDSDALSFNYSENKSLLYTYFPSKHIHCEIQSMMTWSLEALLSNIFSRNNQFITVPKIPAHLNKIDIFGSAQGPNSSKNLNCILNINPFIAKHYFTRYQHSFFYTDEKITDQTFYVASDFPSMIIGTNYGRVFIVQMFQDFERRAYPVVVIDCHNSAPITCMYVAYSSGRNTKSNSHGSSPDDMQRTISQDLAKTMTQKSGGHLIVCSEDGTISITNMNSGDIIHKLEHFQIIRNDREIRRIDSFMKEREANLRQGRRQSVTQHFTTKRYYNLVRVHPMKIFQCCSFGSISKVLEVSIIQQTQLARQKEIQSGAVTNKRAKTHAGNNFLVGNVADDGSEASGPASTGKSSAATAGQNAAAGELPIQGNLMTKGGSSSSEAASPTPNQFDLSMHSTISLQQKQNLLNDADMRASYACLDMENYAVYIIQVKNTQCSMLKLHGLDSAPIGIYQDALQSIVHVITEKNLNVYTYNKRSKQLVRRSNYMFGEKILDMANIISTLNETQQHFKLSGQIIKNNSSEIENIYDQYSFSQQFKDYGLRRNPQGGGNGFNLDSSGHHKVLDYLSLSLSSPLYYHPHNLLSQTFTKTIKDLLPHRSDLLASRKILIKMKNDAENANQNIKQPQDIDTVKNAMRQLIISDFISNERYKSDFNQEYYQEQGAVTPLMTGTSPHWGNGENQKGKSFRQQMIVINTRDMINIFKTRMMILTQSFGQMQKGVQASLDAKLLRQSKDHSQKSESQNGQSKNLANLNAGESYQPNISAEYLQSAKWPIRLLSLVHPFTLDDNLDENLELFFGLSIPFADFRIGVQGVDEAFSFIVSRDDKEKDDKQGEHPSLGCNNNWQYDELIMLLKLSKLKNSARQSSRNIILSNQLSVDNMRSQINKIIFVNSQYWKVSQYLSTIMSSYFLSTLVSIVEYAQQDITTLMQDWLNVMQYITSSSSQNVQGAASQSEKKSGAASSKPLIQKSSEAQAKSLSVSALSQLMLQEDQSISSCARDIIMKPLLSSGSQIEYIKDEINEWEDLIMDTYHKLKDHSYIKNPKEPGSGAQPNYRDRVGSEALAAKASPGHASELPSPASAEPRQRHGTVASPGALEPPSPSLGISVDRSINRFFGELEIRGLVNLSYYTYFSQDGPDQFKINTDVQNKLCKCTVLLTSEVRTKFMENNKENQNLLTILMQLLQTQMRAQVPSLQDKAIKEDVIKILLLIYDIYKKQLKDENLTRVVAENFYLTHPKNSESYLKLTAAKFLLEIGTFFSQDFLLLIHEQATTLRNGPEYQKNVLDVLRYFINGSKEGLDPHLIQIVQTLLKCLDPNDEQLRKNSLTLVSMILSTMVKNYPMVAFHHDSQRLAVGTPPGPVAIYDVRTCAKWKILEGHARSITCVEFDKKGNMLASYSAQDLTLRFWKVGNAGFFQNIMGGTGKSFKEIKLKALSQSLRPPANPTSHRALSPLQQRTGKADLRRQLAGAQGEQMNKCKIKFIDNDKSVELSREDGRTEVHSIR